MSIVYFTELVRAPLNFKNTTVGYSHCQEFLSPGSEGAFIDEREPGHIDYLCLQHGINYYDHVLINRKLNLAEDSAGLKRRPPIVYKSVEINTVEEWLVERYWLKKNKDFLCFYAKYHTNKTDSPMQVVFPNNISAYSTDVITNAMICPIESILKDVLSSSNNINKTPVGEILQVYKKASHQGAYVGVKSTEGILSHFTKAIHDMSTHQDSFNINRNKSKALAMALHKTPNDKEAHILKSPVGFNYISLRRMCKYPQLQIQDDGYITDSDVILPDTYRLHKAVSACSMIASTKFHVDFCVSSAGKVIHEKVINAENAYAPIVDCSHYDKSYLIDIAEGVFFDYCTRNSSPPVTSFITIVKNDMDEIYVEMYREDNTGKYPDATYYFDIPLLILSMNGLQLA